MRFVRRFGILSITLGALLGVSIAQMRDRDTQDKQADMTQPHLGYPQDWSFRHLVMTGDGENDALSSGAGEPRHVYNRVMRQIAIEAARRHPRRPKHAMKVDWAVSLENGFVPQNQFPAKYRFDVTTESCSGDYVIFGLTVASGTQANLVGINNLYTEASPKCNSGTPFVSFAYNTLTHGGQIRTSPTISADGSKIAFVESTSGGSYFHVLVLPSTIPSPPTSTIGIGTVLSPQTPTTCTTPTTANCMTTTTVFGGTNTDSSPWIDYLNDIAYVGTDDGKLYKISPVFGGGAPTVAADTNWPVSVVPSGNSSNVVTDPIVDNTANKIFMGDANGYLYSINLTVPAKATSAQVAVGWVTHGAGTGVVDPPIVVTDSANSATDQVFAFTGCSNVVGVGGAVSQLSANFATGSCVSPSTPGYVAGYCTTVDMGSSDGTGNCTKGNVHSGTFDNQFWINGSTGGHMLGCGFVSGTTGAPLTPSNPKMYMFPFDTNHRITATGSTSFVINNTLGDECSPLTEFYNGTTDRLFFGVGSTTVKTGSPDGFIESSTLTTTMTTPSCGSPPTSSCVTAPHALGGTSGIVVDNQLSNGGTNIYFTTLAIGGVNGQNCKSSASGASSNPYCAVKLTQSGLQ